MFESLQVYELYAWCDLTDKFEVFDVYHMGDVDIAFAYDWDNLEVVGYG